MLNKNKISTNIPSAVAALQDGQLVAFPTETVYGLGADATNPAAIRKVFAAKGRPADHPVIVHIAEAEQLSVWARDIPLSAWELAKHFWPGSLTLILHKHPTVSDLITGGQDTIGIRVPNHPLTLELLHQFGSGLVGPSANKYGHVSPTTAEHVAADLADEVAVILDGGACTVGIESTIVNLTATQPTIMRNGAISAAQIAAVLGQDVKAKADVTNTIRTPGGHASHYAPRTPAYLIASDQLLDTVKQLMNGKQTFAVLSFAARPAELPAHIHWQQVDKDSIKYARSLYANLRALDRLRTNSILIEQPPQTAEWSAIMDRLTRACAPTAISLPGSQDN